jgi:mono/diheme cytochrome c family protein
MKRGSGGLARQCAAACVVAVSLFSIGCWGPKSGRGLYLQDGDIKRGRDAFIGLNCIQCHTVEDEQLPAPSRAGPVQIEIGGPVARIKSYGELVTAIVNPNHVMTAEYKAKVSDGQGKSLMPDYTDKMTVRQLIDLVTFLQAHYHMVEPQRPDYWYPYGSPPTM